MHLFSIVLKNLYIKRIQSLNLEILFKKKAIMCINLEILPNKKAVYSFFVKNIQLYILTYTYLVQIQTDADSKIKSRALHAVPTLVRIFLLKQ